jgi:plastocyanin
MSFGDKWFSRSRVALLLGAIGLSSSGNAAELDVTVRGVDGKPVEHAVVYALPTNPDGTRRPIDEPVVIDQVNKEYVPYVTAVQVGTSVNFPNNDQIRHHVYSFSPVKKFEIPLYKDTPADPIVFDKPGSVALGCNIHDWMKAYVFVSESPYFAVTGAGGSATVDLPAGDYTVEVWHPELKGEPSSTSQPVALNGADAAMDFAIKRKRVWSPRRSPSAGGGGRYR